jgi:probable rRNA maturation factor
MKRIVVRNLQRAIRVDVPALQGRAGKALRLCLKIRGKRGTKLAKLREIHVWLISNRRMSILHRQFLHQSGPTDVITFEHGEIFVSVEMAMRNAKRFGTSLARELQLYVIHGLLHLHGFDDDAPKAALEMKRTQEKVLASLN